MPAASWPRCCRVSSPDKFQKQQKKAGYPWCPGNQLHRLRHTYVLNLGEFSPIPTSKSSKTQDILILRISPEYTGGVIYCLISRVTETTIVDSESPTGCLRKPSLDII